MKGIALAGKKEATLLTWTIRRLDPPKKICIPIYLSPEVFALPCVAAGDRVSTGQKIAHPANPQSVSIYSGVSGTVSALDRHMIEIESDPHDLKAPAFPSEQKNWQNFPREVLLKIFQEQGLVDLSTGRPVHTLLGISKKQLVLNACEPEPYQTCDHALMMAHPLEILRGAEILKHAFGAEQISLVMYDDKREVLETLKSKIYLMKIPNIEIRMMPALFPHGLDASIKGLLRDELGHDDLEVLNIATAFAAFEAVVMNKPFFERVVTVGGECIIEPKNIWARIGMNLESVVKAGRGFLRPPGKLLIGGPMTGIPQKNLNEPVTAASALILALPEELTKPEKVEPCIRCTRCIEVCPEDLSPAMITLAAERNLKEVAEEYGSQLCTLCGNCQYVCPAHRPMTELIRYVQQSG